MSGMVEKQPVQLEQRKWGRDGLGRKKARIRNEAKQRIGSEHSTVSGQSEKLGLTQRVIYR